MTLKKLFLAAMASVLVSTGMACKPKWKTLKSSAMSVAT